MMTSSSLKNIKTRINIATTSFLILFFLVIAGIDLYFSDFSFSPLEVTVQSAMLILFILIGFSLARIFSTPITSIAAYALEISRGNLNLPDLQINRRDELGAINQSLQDILTMIRSRLAFSEGVVHNMPMPFIVGDHQVRLMHLNFIDKPDSQEKKSRTHGNSVFIFCVSL